MFSWFRTRRRRRLLAAPFPSEWVDCLEENVHHYLYLPPADQAQLRDRVKVFVGEKNWVGCGGLIIDDEVRVTIAGQACLMLLGIEGDYSFDSVRSILVYPGPYDQPGRQRPDRLLVSEVNPTSGEAWHRGPIVLSWEHALAGGRDVADGRNLVFHEFAHLLDDLEGGMDGVPPLANRGEYQRWDRVTEQEYHRLCRAAQSQQVTLLDQYGAASRAEFFAVATECFFERPTALRDAHPELYEVLRGFFHLDPAVLFGGDPRGRPVLDAHGRPLTPEQVQETRYEESVRRCVRDMRLAPDSADAAFAAGVVHAENGRHDRAVDHFNQALARDPQDSEAYRYRAASCLELGRVQEALADCDAAIRLDPHDVECYRARGRVYVRLGDYERAIDDLDRVVQADRRDADGYYQRGLAWASAGEYERALGDYGQAIRCAPAHAEYYAARSHAYEHLGQAGEAEADRREALRREAG